METMDKEVKDKQLVESDEILITKKDLRKVFLNSMTIMCSWNYERQMHMGFMFGMAPIIDKLYKNNEKEKRAAYKRHMEFFNCTPQMTSFIMGLSASMEEQNAKSNGEFNAESISMIKTSLMGPFAGIGDSFFQGTLRIITFGIGLSFAKQGSILGPILAVGLFAIPSLLTAYYGTFLGYKSGNRIITFGIGLSFAKQGSILGPILAVGLFAIPSLLTAYYGTFLGYKSGNNYLAKIYQEGLMDRIMQFASIIGLAVVGGMVASMVPISTPIEFTTGGTQLVLQDMIDSILPKFLPLVSTMGIYWLIKKKVNTNILLFGIIILGMVLSLLGVL